jgi:hypothetical protein
MITLREYLAGPEAHDIFGSLGCASRMQFLPIEDDIESG